MLTKIDVECDNPFYMSIQGAKPRDSLIIQSITGLGPPDKNLFIGEYSRDGGVYTGRRVLMRYPVLTIKLNPNYKLGETTAGLRQMLYKAFNDPNVDGDDVTLLLHDDVKPDTIITGYTEKFEGELFGSDTTVQISMQCPDPYIRDAVQTVITPPAGVNGWQTVPFTYSGDAEAGFEITIEVQATTSTITLDNNGKTMILTYPSFQIGDIVYINTKPGERQINFTRDGVVYEILYALYSESPWLSLHSQTNVLQVYGETSSNIVAAVTSLVYTQTYWGV